VSLTYRIYVRKSAQNALRKLKLRDNFGKLGLDGRVMFEWTTLWGCGLD